MRLTSLLNLRYLFGLLFIVGLMGAGCGDDDGSGDVPDNAVATVDGVAITKSAYDEFHPSTRVANPDPQQAEIAAMQILLQREWTDQEAKAEGIEVTDAQVRRALLEQRAQFFKKESAYRNYLRRSKRTEKDLYAGMKQKLQMDKLSARAAREAPQIDDARVEQYYEKNRQEFALPKRYLVHTIISRTEAQANKAKQAAQKGTDWKEIFATYSPKGAQAPDAWKARPLPGKTGIKEVDQALATAKAGDEIVEKTQYGWVMIGVEKVIPAEQQSFDKVKADVKARLVASRREDASNAFFQKFQDEYKDKTVCAEEYKVAECKNGPDENPKPKPPSEQRASPTNTDAGEDN